MKIAMVSPYDYAYPGGVNSHISNLSSEMAKMGHQVKILAPCSNKKKLPHLEEVIPLGKTIPYPSNGSIARLTLSWWLTPRIKSLLEEEKFDIIHFHEPLFPSLPWMVLPSSRSINIGTFHAFYKRSFGYRFWKPLCRRYYNRLHGKIAVSQSAKRFVSKYFPSDYHIIPHGVDVHRFSAEVQPFDKYLDGKLNILFVSRLEGRKGIHYLLKAYRIVKKAFPDSRLLVVGPGNPSRYSDWVHAVKLKDVVFAGYASYDDLPRYYRTADIFCVPAVGRESFGIILLEAMGAGKPIVATSIDGYADVVAHGTEGLLVPPKNVKMLSEALLVLLRDEELRLEMGRRGREKVEKLSWTDIARRTLAYYEEILKGQP